MSDQSISNGGIPWVSFCMTTYKRPRFLREQLEAISKQTFANFEIIISDNDPEGSAETVVKEFNDPRVRYYINEANLGMVKSFNRSLQHARSEYVVMITDDDPVYPEMLSTLRDLSLQHPGYGMYMGGCDIQCKNPEVARSSRLRVGTNSCLANIEIGSIRTYSSEQFPYAYFANEIGCHLLWSTGIVKRSIALEIEGMPDFGAPYNTDFGYIVLAGAHSGAVLLNTSLGCQVVHGTNYGFTEADFNKFYITPEAFVKWVLDHLPKHVKYPGLEKVIHTFTARWVVEYAVSIYKFMKSRKLENKDFHRFVDKIFRIPFLRKWKFKYIVASRYPRLFAFMLYVKQELL